MPLTGLALTVSAATIPAAATIYIVVMALAAYDDQERRVRLSCFSAKELSWRAGSSVHSLLRWTRTGKRDRRTASPPPVLPGSDVQRALDRHHGGAAGVDGVDDLGVVDALEVDRGDAEVGVAELALDDDQRHALAGH